MEKNNPGFAAIIGCLIAACMLLTRPAALAQDADTRLLHSIYDHRNANLDGAMYRLSQSVYPIAIAAPVATLVYGYASNNATFKQNGWQMTAGLGLTAAITFGLKYTIHRDRPYVANADIIPYTFDNDPSFPSGHTAFAFATATSLSMQYPRWYVIAPSYIYASAVGYSRLHLGMHYPSDVLAGAVIGTASAWLSFKGNQWLNNRKHKSSTPTEQL